MVQDIRRIHSDRKRLGLAELERLLDVGIKKELSPGHDVAIAERSDLSRKGIHEAINDVHRSVARGAGV